ncbi:MAG: hypothetical protein O4804_01835 [Trichodesmium sp. St11_bin5]|nr:hypothetical protein [Trichodesmium sp. St11_bin5]
MNGWESNNFWEQILLNVENKDASNYHLVYTLTTIYEYKSNN